MAYPRGFGYVLDFSDPEIADFFEDEFGIDFEEEKYLANGTSKKNRLMTFIELEDPSTVAQVLQALYDHREGLIREAGGGVDGEEERKNQEEFLKIIAAVEGNVDPSLPETTDEQGASSLPAVPTPSPVGLKTTSTAAVPTKVSVFFSYSHEDEQLRDELAKHLSGMARQGVIDAWHDRRIPPGNEWEHEIDEHLEKAEIILLLVSSSFLASDYCYDVELKRALERHEAGDAVVIPVILRPVHWKGAAFGKLQALPRDAKPVTGPDWHSRDEAFTDVARGIRQVVEELRQGSYES